MSDAPASVDLPVSRFKGGPCAPAVRRIVGVLLSALLAGSLLACGGGVPQPRPLTEKDSQLLAVSRFNNFDAGAREISATIRDTDSTWELRGWYDYERGVGYAALSNAAIEKGPADALLLWSQHTLLSRPAGEARQGELPPSPVPDADDLGGAWQQTGYDPSTYPAHAGLLVIANLGADRPENPLLLQQSDALWLREDAVGDTPVTVFMGPTSGDATAPRGDEIDPNAGTIRYWVDTQGKMLRVEMRLTQDGFWSSVELEPGAVEGVPQLPELPTPEPEADTDDPQG